MAAPVITDSVIAGAAGTDTVTTGNVVVGGSNRALYVFVGNSDGTPKTVSSVTWNVASPESLTQIHDTTTANFQRVEVWRLIAPTAGTDNVTVTLSGSTTAAIVVVVAVEDIDQSTPNGTVVKATGTGSADSSVAVGSAVGKRALDFIYRFSNDLDVGADQTELENVFQTEASAASSHEAGAATNTFTWGIGGSGTVSNWEWTGVALSLNEVGGGGSSSTTVTPTTGGVVLVGQIPSMNPFTNVRIREVLINNAGSPVANKTGIHLKVWYGGRAAGAPDLSYSDKTTDGDGTTSWSLATGSLVYNQAIFYVADDGGASLSQYTCARMVPTYT
jgi:hypothetical protein